MSVPVTTGRLLLRGQSSVVQIIRKGSDRKRCCVCTRVRECVRARVRVHNCRERNSTRDCLSPALSPVGGSARATELREGERLSASHSNASGRPQFPEMFSCSEAARPPATLAGPAVPSPSPANSGLHTRPVSERRGRLFLPHVPCLSSRVFLLSTEGQLQRHPGQRTRT